MENEKKLNETKLDEVTGGTAADEKKTEETSGEKDTTPGPIKR